MTFTHICKVVKGTFIRVAFNISAFVLILGSIWFLEKEWWRIAGFIFLTLGLLFGIYSVYTFNLNKSSKYSQTTLLKIAMLSLLVLCVSELAFKRWELSLFILACISYLWFCYRTVSRSKVVVRK